MYYTISPSPTAQVLAHRLQDWWYRQGQFRVYYTPWPPRPQPTEDEHIRAIAAELEQDAELMAMKLCSFLGTPEGQVVEAAVEMTDVPPQYRPFVHAAVKLICQRQAGRKMAAAGVLMMAAGVVIALVAAMAE